MKTILVADDKEDIRAFMRVALEAAGYEVRSASDGAQALALLRERPADLLITDIFMPEKEGIETLWECKADFPNTRMIAMSAGGGTKHDFLSTAALMGADATLRKPFDADQLLGIVRLVLEPR